MDDTMQFAQDVAACKVRLREQTTFFGLLMQRVVCAVDTQCPTACTDGRRIYFGIPFCTRLDADELLFVMWHELMHIVLGHCFRAAGHDAQLYNIAADIVVNSTIRHMMSISISIDNKPLMHLTPKGEEGYLYTAEEVYHMLIQSGYVPPKNAHGDENSEQNDGEDAFWDDHSSWDEVDRSLQNEWDAYAMDAANVVQQQTYASKSDREMAERVYKALAHPTLDWRLLLHNFVQTQPFDYSFLPPDRRFDSFFLPDLNVNADVVSGLWLVIDTSGSIRNCDIARAFAEVQGGIEQFEGNLCGYLSFFDTRITPPVPFSTVEDVAAIRPRGGGGTSFHVIFDYLKDHIDEMEITGLVIFTDGYAPFPPEEAALGVPVFWLINNAMVTPPWGVVARYLPEQ